VKIFSPDSEEAVHPWIKNLVPAPLRKFEFSMLWTSNVILCPTVGFDLVKRRKNMSLIGSNNGSGSATIGFKSISRI